MTIRSAAGSEQLACDSVVLAFGIVPDRVLPESLEDRSKVEVIGDCRDLGSAADAIHEGFLAGLRA